MILKLIYSFTNGLQSQTVDDLSLIRVSYNIRDDKIVLRFSCLVFILCYCLTDPKQNELISNTEVR